MAAYERALHAAGSPLANDRSRWEQAKEHARRSLIDLVASLRAGAIRVAEDDTLRARDTDTATVAPSPNPTDSWQAAAIFFEITLMHVLRRMNESDHSSGLIPLTTASLYRSISRHIEESCMAHSGFLLNRIHKAHVEERRRIARELHDRVGHDASMALRSIELAIISQDDPAQALRTLKTAQVAVQEILRSVRALTSDLRLQEPLASLEQGLEVFIASVKSPGMDVRLRVNGNETWASPEVRDESFFILREAIRNAAKHGAPALILVRVDIAPHELRATVEDDGCGFDPRLPRRSGGAGLCTMAERADLIGGTVTVMRRPSRGCKVELIVPLVRRASLQRR
ncbi:histidine kinase/DNA gyrase B/HSP90-like ATPase [Nonomuraea polychroma]|uniref:histidine kinase n=2 Tax=Nonomuraea polychroma TaxID=46176 RepID=A0A438M216_9ACTN|nr:histidine kinase/DNA gyrase B/HSP90-like ATPase [Nonomuraea polychroma]